MPLTSRERILTVSILFLKRPSFDELSFLSGINRATASEVVTMLFKALTMSFQHVFGQISCNRATSSLHIVF